ncbi:MAG: metallophosphoesterase family protein [Candidatus Lokiarchaeota archaeon]|nr:metallophosphoesterase family protein [Candidatus Lokiarchaeota archaeon]
MVNTTKLAIISDIHANKYALDSFLQYNEEHFQAEKILNLGDFTSIGPNPKEVAQTIFTDKRFENIIGNNEMIVLGKRKNEWMREKMIHHEWIAKHIGKDLLAQIDNTPTSKTLDINGKKILMLHSHFYDTPGRTMQDNLLIYQEKTLEEFFDDYPKDVDIVLVGHSHLQLYMTWKKKHIINPGSISITWKPITSFCLLEIDDTSINVDFKNIPYDYSKLKEDYQKNNVAAKDFLIKYFYPFI